MKDLYSFHANKEDLKQYYERSKEIYLKIFKRLGFDPDLTFTTYASGGAFSQFSHEFQVVSEVGEDTIYICEKCHLAINKEIIEIQSTCPQCNNPDLKEEKAIEIGNIFILGTRFSQAFDFKFTDEDGQMKLVHMGCYGIGPSRIMGTLVELSHDEKGIIWPKSVAPYQVHLVTLGKDEVVQKACDSLYQELQVAGIEVLYDDRDKQAGAKLADADLIGIPVRLVISSRTLETGSVEWKERSKSESEHTEIPKLVNKIKEYYS